jgi:putative addiction module killer protein
VIELIEAADERGNVPFAVFRDSLDRNAHSKVVLAVYRLASGNYSAAKGIDGIFELRLNFGPGYRVYFGKDGEQIILLLGGGTRSVRAEISKTRRHSGTHISK